jgi:hypothetical protein
MMEKWFTADGSRGKSTRISYRETRFTSVYPQAITAAQFGLSLTESDAAFNFVQGVQRERSDNR